MEYLTFLYTALEFQLHSKNTDRQLRDFPESIHNQSKQHPLVHFTQNKRTNSTFSFKN